MPREYQYVAHAGKSQGMLDQGMARREAAEALVSIRFAIYSTGRKRKKCGPWIQQSQIGEDAGRVQVQE